MHRAGTAGHGDVGALARPSIRRNWNMNCTGKTGRLPRAGLLPAVIAATLAAHGAAASGAELDLDEPVIVTGARMAQPLVVETDPKLPRQPLPASDGADYLKTIPGFSVTRKGGTDGDPVFRGMAASRVNMLMDGETVLGGCGMRMDPPTAYVFPAAYDRIVVVKGPQTVLYGPGNSAATVRFDRDPPRFDAYGYQFAGNGTVAGAGRSDLAADLALGSRGGYARVAGTHGRSDDYTDGDGNKVHSAYERWSANGALGWRPTEDSWVELSGTTSDGHAAYADRMMDGVKFDRSNIAVRLAVDKLGDVVQRVEGLAFHNYVDHVMDNYSLREFVPTMMMPAPSASNPDRLTEGGRVALELALAPGLNGTVGMDAQRNVHRVRSTMNEPMMPYESMPRAEDAAFYNWGAFAEFTRDFGRVDRVIAGARADRWHGRDARETLALGMVKVPNPTAGAERDETLVSGFGRYEHDLARATVYAGLGYVERFPDYWELIGNGRESTTSLSAFETRPEKTTQLDVGLVFAGSPFTYSVSAFASRVNDFILIESSYAKGMRLTSVARNVKATTWGLEGDAGYTLAPGWRLGGTLAWTWGRNETDNRPLGQIPPLEARLSLDYQRGAWSAGALLRAVAAQDRVAINQGNVVGQDIGPSAGFAVASLNGGYRLAKGWSLTTGVDNLFDRAYAEHISRAGAMVAGFEQATRVNEPGRTLWMNLSAQF
jgi:iron complex outermembrane receptor protein